MAFLVNVGYQAALELSEYPKGGILIASTLSKHTLERCDLDKKYPHLTFRLFDPQLYLSGLDANISPDHCADLSSYPWFCVPEVDDYESSEQKQSDWKKDAKKKISSQWQGTHSTEPDRIREAVGKCIEFQINIGCGAIIFPSPLTVDLSTDYRDETMWLDMGIQYIQERGGIDLPIYATVALSDLCTFHLDPPKNNLLQLILDVVSSREVDGVYLVIEQSSESDSTRHLRNTRSLWTALHLTYIFSHDCELDVCCNFFGSFGLILEAVGAKYWASGWYKSLYRLRLADKARGGRVYPSFWANLASVDIHLDEDFDKLNEAGVLSKTTDKKTTSSAGLLDAAAQGIKVKDVPDWVYRVNNRTSARNHFILSQIDNDSNLSRIKEADRLDYVQNKLTNAVQFSVEIATTLGPTGKTSVDHVQSWLDALIRFRDDHNI